MGLFAFVPPGGEKHRIGRVESKNFEPFVGRLMGRAVPQKKKAIEFNGLVQLLAERVGFEPTVGGCPTPDFESGTFDHSATSPQKTRIICVLLAFVKRYNCYIGIFLFSACPVLPLALPAHVDRRARIQPAGAAGGRFRGRRRPSGWCHETRFCDRTGVQTDRRG